MLNTFYKCLLTITIFSFENFFRNRGDFLIGVTVSLCWCDKTLKPKEIEGNHRWFHFRLPGLIPSLGGSQDSNSSRNLKQQPQRHAACYLSYCVLLIELFYVFQSFLTRDDTTSTGMCPPASIKEQGNTLQICLKANLIKAMPQLKLYSQMRVGCVKLALNDI